MVIRFAPQKKVIRRS